MNKLVVENIHKTYGSHEVLKDVSLSAKAGDVVAIIGSSGSGKSTFLRCINFLEKPNSGTVTLNGQTLSVIPQPNGREPKVSDSKLLQQFRTKLSMVFQHFNLWSHMSVMHNVMEAPLHVLGISKDEARQRAENYLTKVGLTAAEYDKYPSQLSGGQQQRAALGRILVNKPRFLMLDEPFSALDTYLRERLQAEMRELLKSYGGPVLLVTHSRDEAYRLCRSIAVMDKGSSTPPRLTKELFEDPHTVAAASLTGCKNISKAEKRGEHQLYAVDWGVTLSTASELHDGLCAVGVRAHDIHEEERHNRYAIVCGQPIEDPFELTQPFTFACQGDKKMLLWVKLQRREPYSAPKEVGIAPDKVLPLYEK